jgi:hypothetical protein
MVRHSDKLASCKEKAAMYVSEFTQFINQLHKDRPDLDAEQQKGRAIWWDQPVVTPDVRQKLHDATLVQPAYVYQIKG